MNIKVILFCTILFVCRVTFAIDCPEELTGYLSETANEECRLNFNELEKKFIDTKSFELSYSWSQLPDHIIESIRGFIGNNSLVLDDFGKSTGAHDLIFGDYSRKSFIYYYGKATDIEFIHFDHRPIGTFLIIYSKSIKIPFNACLYRTSNMELHTDDLRFLFLHKLNIEDNYSRGVELSACDIIIE